MADLCIHDMPRVQCGYCNQDHQPVKCRQCGRELTDVLSRKTGVGPTCFGNDSRAQNWLFREIQGWARVGPFTPGGSTAVNWQTALLAIGVEAHIRTDENDAQYLYFNRDGS